MSGLVGFCMVLAASVSWYVSHSLQSKVDPDKDGYGEGMQYVKHVNAISSGTSKVKELSGLSKKRVQKMVSNK